MKKINVCIVTVYNSVNSGSFWQAKAFEIFLRKNNINVFFYRRRNKGIYSSSSKINHFLRRGKLLLKGDLKGLRGLNNSFSAFNTLCSKFSVITNSDIIYSKIDYFILGSDTIWNIDEKFFLNEYNIYFGKLFPDKKVFSYAASVGNTTIEKLQELGDIDVCLNRLISIGVRDNYTLSLVNKICNKNVSLVCDTTMLLSKHDYENILKDFNITKPKKKYIFVYLFDNLCTNQVNDITKYAKSHNLKVISGTKKFDWCDECIVNEPLNFLNYMNNAQYVITDTFHGTVFSVNLRKQFSVIDREKNKVNDFLKVTGFIMRKENQDTIQNFNNDINYCEKEKMLSDFVRKSKQFLFNIINNR